MIPVIGLGAGGHARVILDILRLSGQFDVVGLLSPDINGKNTRVDGVPIIGDDSHLPSLRLEVRHAFMGIGSVRASKKRQEVYARVTRLGFEFVTAIHPGATVAASAALGKGVVIMAGAIVNPGTLIGDNAILNTGSIVDHDCHVSDHVHIAPCACLAGSVSVGRNSHIGMGAIVLQGITIGEESTVGAGAVVIEDVPAGSTVTGIPARILGPKQDKRE
jgi:sugar O-acyltransferase (sialic acid O-acetyltransferase NeuD family)